MFEKSKVIWHLTQIEASAGTNTACREAIAKLASVSGLMDTAIKFVKENREFLQGNRVNGITLDRE